MSAQTNQTRSASTLFVLIGALAFTLSSLPGGKDSGDSSSFSSVSACELEDQLNSGNSAGCSVQSGKVTGRIDVNLTDKTTVVRNADDFSKIEPGKKTQVWRVQVSGLDVEGMETDCAACDEAIRKSAQDHIDVMDLHDLKKVVAAAQALFDRQAKALADAATTARALAVKKENCQVDEDGAKITSTKEVLKCKVDRMAGMDREKAADYYDDKIQPDLAALAVSENPADRRTAALMILPGGPLAKTRNPYVLRSIDDLGKLAMYTERARAYQTTLGSPLSSAQAKLDARAQLQKLEANWGQYFAQQGLKVQNLATPSGFGDFDFAGGLYDDILGQGGYNDALNARFASIADQHNLAINAAAGNLNNTTGAGVNTDQSVGSGRTLHGTPTVSLGGAGGANTQAQLYPNMQQQQQFGGQQRMPVQQNGATGLNAHRLGMPVR